MQLFLYHNINKKKVKTIILNFNVRSGFSNQSVLINYNSFIQCKIILYIVLMHTQFVKRFYSRFWIYSFKPLLVYTHSVIFNVEYFLIIILQMLCISILFKISLYKRINK